MERVEFKGKLCLQEEFLYPDSPCDTLPDSVRFVMAKNGRRHLQLLLETACDEVHVRFESDHLRAKCHQMLAIPVEYNTGDGEEQGGAMILENRPSKKPAYATRLAPFHVYDCLKPCADGCVPAVDGRAAVCLFITLNDPAEAGTFSGTLHVDCGGQEYVCRVEVQAFDVAIPEDRFPVTYWFSIEDICRFHNAEFNTSAYFEMLDRYIEVMRGVRQNVFFMLLDDRCVVSRLPYAFDFEYLTPTIEAFFRAGMKRMEIGHLLSRGRRPDGSKDMYTGVFKCAMAENVPVNSMEGYAITVAYVKALGDYLKRHGWLEKTLFHIHDEPDIHVENDAAVESRKRDYQLAGNILRRIIPGARVIEATKSPTFRGSIDVLVPDTAGYEAYRSEFELLRSLGHEIWSYVCCGPEGHWLNRFLDFALIKDRLLFWGFAKNNIQGFLQWGLNQFPDGMNPFVATECPNDTGIGTNFPCGDSFMLYPGDDGPWVSMRYEAWRQGAEDIELLHDLKKADAAAAEKLIAEVFTDNQHYDEDPEHFESVYQSLLEQLEKIG